MKIFENREKRNQTLLYTGLGFALLAALGIVLRPQLELLLNVEELRAFIESFGVWAPLALIAVQVAQVLAAPVPGHVVGTASGYAFGILWGTFYAWIGLTLGSAGAILLSKRYGRPFVEKVVDDSTLNQLDGLTEKHGFLPFFLMFLLPGFPDDAVCFIAGLTNLNKWKMIAYASIGRIPGLLSLTVIGDSLAVGNIALMIGTVLLVALWSLGAWHAREKIINPGEKARKPWKALKEKWNDLKDQNSTSESS